MRGVIEDRSAFTELGMIEFWSQRKTWIEIRVKSENMIVKFLLEPCLNVADKLLRLLQQ